MDDPIPTPGQPTMTAPPSVVADAVVGATVDGPVTITKQALAELIATAIRETQPPAPTATQKALTLHPKVAASGIGGYLAVVVLYALNMIWGIDPPAEVAASLTGLIMGALAWLAPRAPGGS